MPDQLVTTPRPQFNPAVADLPMVGRGGVVPYVAKWTGETTPDPIVVERDGGVAFADETDDDRDPDMYVLWDRAVERPGDGQPLYTVMHPHRQRRAMHDLLCQVCAQPADPTDQSHLWLLSAEQRTEPGWPAQADTTLPPLCVACARASVRACPWLRQGQIAVRARSSVYGIYGVRYQPTCGRPVPVDVRLYSLRDTRIAWTIATHLARTLTNCTVVDLDNPQ